MLQQSLNNKIRLIGTERKIATILTRTPVDRNNPAFTSPNKPIGQECELQFH
jgi:carbamate kinase